MAVLLAAGCWVSCSRVSAGPNSPGPFQRAYRVGIAPWVLDKQHGKNVDAFLAALASAGYTPNVNLEVKIVDAVGNAATQAGVIRDFAGWPADMIYVLTAEGSKIAREVSPDVPMVFSDVAYPLEHGLVERLEFSANKSVGIKSYIPIEEQMALAARLLPKDINKIAVCLRSGDPDARRLLEEMRKVVSLQGASVYPIEVSDVPSLTRSLSDPQLWNMDVFYLSCDSMMQGYGADVVIEFAARRGIPILSCGMTAVEKGALAGVAVDQELEGRLAGQQAAQILAGRTPTSLQSLVAGPPQVVVNRRAARALGVHIPETFLGEEVHVYE